jgi:mxaA protein
MKLRAAFLVILLGAACGGAMSAPRTPSVTVSNPRAFGYFIGDVIDRKVVLRLGPHEKLDMASLPRPGPLNYWLELSGVAHSEKSDGEDTLYTLQLSYQAFYGALDPRRLVIPGFKLGLSTGGDVSVPEFGFITSPIRQLFAANSQSSGSAVEVQPDQPAPRLATGAERTALLISSLVALAALTGLAWHNAWWPFHRRPARPFTDAARYLKANSARLGNAQGYRAALLKLHRAFDLAAGRRLLSEDVASFLDAHPEYQTQSGKIGQLFRASRRAFFANDVDEAQAEMPLAALVDLSAGLSVAERRAA